MHNLQKPIVGTLVQGWTKNPCLAAGLIDMKFNFKNIYIILDNKKITLIMHLAFQNLCIKNMIFCININPL